MAIQQTLVIIKPDGLARGLAGQILCEIELSNIKVIDSIRTKLSRNWVKSLYKGEEHEVYYNDVVNWMSSNYVLMLKVEGLLAIDIVKWKIIGRYPDGIRGRHADNWIKNIAHAPDSKEAAFREITLSNSIFKRSNTMREALLRNKTIFALTGMSESGKSAIGKYFESIGVPRLKIVNLFENIRDENSPGENLYKFIDKEENKDPYALWDLFIEKLMAKISNLGTNMVSIESLYGGGLGPYLKQKLEKHFCLIYVDIPLDIRLQRQIIRENLASIEDAKKILLPRDQVKEESGIPELEKIADIVIDNSGSLKDLYSQIDKLIKKYD